MSLFASITNPANKNSCGAQCYPLFGAQNHSLYSAHWAYEGYYLYPGEYQVYKTYLPLFQEHTKSTGSLKTTKKLRLIWPLDSAQ